MPSVDALLSEQIKNAQVNQQTWGTMLINVESYGVNGDGTNESSKLQNAINAAVTYGAKVFFPHTNKTYLFGDVDIPDNVEIDGNFVTIQPVSTASCIFKAVNRTRPVIQRINFSDPNGTFSNPCILIDSVRSPRIGHINFDNVYMGIKLVSTTSTTNTTREGRIHDLVGDNIRNTGIWIGTDVHDNRFDDIFLAGKSGSLDGIHFDASNPVANIIGGNIFSNILCLSFGGSGFYAKNCLEIWASNIIADTCGEGLVFDGCNRMFLSNVWGSTSSDNGIKAVNSSIVYVNGFYGWNNTNNDLFVDSGSTIFLDDKSSYYTKSNIGTNASIKGRRKIGTLTVTAGQTTGDLAHGLGEVPSTYQITPTSDYGSGNRWWVSSVTATDLIISMGSAPASNATFNVEVQS